MCCFPLRLLVPVGAHCHAPSAPCPPSPLLPPFACSSRDPIATRYEKLYKRIGFLFFAYNKGYWWFEPVLLLYKLSMTVLILFVSDGDENKILFGMLGATAMMATLAFFQPFKHPDILSINTGAQVVVLLVLFAAMFLLVNGGGSNVIAVVLVLSTIVPLVAGVVMTLRLPKDARLVEAGDTISGDLSSMMGSVADRFMKRSSKMPGAVRGTAMFSADNPMHAESYANAGGVEMQDNPGISSSQPRSETRRPSDLVTGERSEPNASTEEEKCVI